MLSRRAFLQAGVAATTSAAFPAPYLSIKPKVTLRVMGTHVTLQEPLRQRAQRELGFNIEFYPGGSAQVLYQATTQPESFDLYEQWSNSTRVLWNSGAIAPIDVDRLRYWSEINNLTRTGKLVPEARVGAGDAPFTILNVQPDGNLGSKFTGKISFLPYVHNVDSFGYNSEIIPAAEPYKEESWTWLLDPKWAGKVAIVNEPTIGIFDLALAASGAGLVTFQDIGNLSRAELDELFRVLLEFKDRGQFRGVWNSVPNSVELMKNREVYLESMFSPAASSLRGQGVPCVYAAPKEGYRAWHGVMCLSSKTVGYVEEAAYEYMNWWLSGWPGAFIARQGYYISNPQRSRQFLSDAEWRFWYAGLPAEEDLRGTDDRIVARRGEERRGGSYEQRFSNVAVWNTVMDTYEYSLERWGEFLA